MTSIFGNDDANVLTGGSGDDLIYGLDGDDRIFGRDGDDELDGGFGNDHLSGGTGDDRLTGGSGNDRLAGGAGFDILSGDDGRDLLISGAGFNDLDGGSGNDRLVGGSRGTTHLYGGEGNDVLDGRPRNADAYGDIDIADFGSVTLDGVIVNLKSGVASDGTGGTDTLYDIEEVIGTSEHDVITGGNPKNDSHELFDGGAGNDDINGGSGFDYVLYGTTGYFTETFGIRANLTAGVIHDQWGDIDTVKNVEGILASGKDDVLVGSAADNSFQPGAGSDFISGRDGFDEVFYQSASYYGSSGIYADLQAGFVSEGNGNTDRLRSIEGLRGSSMNDTLRGSGEANRLFGGEGRDFISGRGGKDVLAGESGDDHLNGGAGRDVLAGGAGGDQLRGGSGADIFVCERHGGEDHILDFDPDADKINVSACGFDSAADVLSHLSRIAPSTYMLHLGNGDFVIFDYSTSAFPLSADNIIL